MEFIIEKSEDLFSDILPLSYLYFNGIWYAYPASVVGVMLGKKLIQLDDVVFDYKELWWWENLFFNGRYLIIENSSLFWCIYA